MNDSGDAADANADAAFFGEKDMCVLSDNDLTGMVFDFNGRGDEVAADADGDAADALGAYKNAEFDFADDVEDAMDAEF